eukprot:g5923.t1
MSAPQAKTCVICGQDCAGLPRLKNDKGQYAHKACVTNKQTPQPNHEPEADPYALDDDAGLAMDDLLGDLDPTDNAPGPRAACPSCGNALADGAVVCMGCGHNTQTGKTLSSKVLKPKADRPDSIPVPTFATGPIVTTLVGAAVAAFLGAAIWAGIIIGVQVELRFIAIIIGAMVGIGAAYGARGNAGFLSGSVAVVFALAAIIAGRYIGVSSIVDSEITRVSSEMRSEFEDLSDDEQAQLAKQRIADDLLNQRVVTGESPDPDTDLELIEWGYYPEDYPDEIIDQTELAWSELARSSPSSGFGISSS